MASNVPEFLDQQADALACAGQDLAAQQVRQVAAEFRALEQRVHELEAENSQLVRDTDRFQRAVVRMGEAFIVAADELAEAA